MISFQNFFIIYTNLKIPISAIYFRPLFSIGSEYEFIYLLTPLHNYVYKIFFSIY